MLTKEDRCQAIVWVSFYHHQCRRRFVIIRNGERYCKVHDPEYIKEKDRIRREEWGARINTRMNDDRIKHSGAMLLQACKDALEASHDPAVEKILMSVIAKVNLK